MNSFPTQLQSPVVTGGKSVKWSHSQFNEPHFYVLLKEIRTNSITFGLLQVMLGTDSPIGMPIAQAAYRLKESILLTRITNSMVSRAASRLWQWGFLEKSIIDNEPHYRIRKQNLISVDDVIIDVLEYHLLLRQEARKTTREITRILKNLKTLSASFSLEKEVGFSSNNEELSQ